MRKFEEIYCEKEVHKIRANKPDLTSLELRGGRPCPNINDDDMTTIINELSKNCVISTLCLAENDITDKGLNEIHQLKYITSLDLAANNLTDESIKHLIKMEQLTFLNLSENEISENGVELLCEKLINLKYLFLPNADVSLIDRNKIPQSLKVYCGAVLILRQKQKIPQEKNRFSF